MNAQVIQTPRLRQALARAMDDPHSPLTQDEHDGLLADLAESARVVARERAGLEAEQPTVAVRVGRGDVDAVKRWLELQTKRQALKHADHFHGQLRAEVTRLHQQWTPETQARRDARIALERHFDALRLEVQNLAGELKTYVTPPAAKVKRFGQAALELSVLNQKLLELTRDRHRFNEERRTAQDWFGSESRVLHVVPESTP